MLRELRDWAEELACRAGLDGMPSGGRLVVIVAVVVAVLVAVWFAWAGWPGGANGSGAGVGGASSVSAPSETVSGSLAGVSTPTAASTVTVHVVGEVRHPGVYELRTGARAIDAVDAAGGLLGDADQNAVNLARVLSDGEQILVPKPGEAPPAAGAGGGTGAAAQGGGKVDLNTATADQLDALPGVGPATAQKIIADRTNNGPFRTVEDLMRVAGIGPSKFDALKDLVTVR